MMLTEKTDQYFNPDNTHDYGFEKKKIDRVCPTCGTEFTTKSRTQVYCCKECRPSWKKRNS